MKQSVLVIATLEAASDNEDDVTDEPAWIGNTPILTPEEVSKLGQRYRQRLRSLQSVDEIASLAGLTPPSFVDGRSLSPLLSTSPPSSWRSALLVEHWQDENGDPYAASIPDYKALRTGRYLFVR